MYGAGLQSLNRGSGKMEFYNQLPIETKAIENLMFSPESTLIGTETYKNLMVRPNWASIETKTIENLKFSLDSASFETESIENLKFCPHSAPIITLSEMCILTIANSHSL